MMKGKDKFRSDKWLDDEIKKAIAEADQLRAEALRTIKRQQDADKIAAWTTVGLVMGCLLCVCILAALISTGAGHVRFEAVQAVSNGKILPVWALLDH